MTFSVLGRIASVLMLLALTSAHALATSKITAVHSGKCLDVVSALGENGANVQQWDCHGGTNQKWEVSKEDGSVFVLE